MAHSGMWFCWICALKSCHLGKVKWNQPGIFLLVNLLEHINRIMKVTGGLVGIT